MPVLGLAEWRPTATSLAIVNAVREILVEYKDYLPLTGRQIFYRLVGSYDYTKTEEAYKVLLSKLNRARRSGLIPFEAIRDDGVMRRGPVSYRDYFASLLSPKHCRFLDRQAGQAVRLELWAEATGMVPQLREVAAPFGIEVYSSGGFNSTTMKSDAADRALEAYDDDTGRATKILHVGDHDPSGVALYENLVDDVPQFVWDRQGIDDVPEFRRIAITPGQIEGYALEEAPPKRTDSRTKKWRGGTVQVEAMSPSQLADEVREAIEDEIDLEVFERTVEPEEPIRKRIRLQLRKIREEIEG